MIKITKRAKNAWVTFMLPADTGDNIKISGDWNNWENEKMIVKKNGDFYITKLLKSDKTYQFGYQIDEQNWANDDSLQSVSNNSLLKL